MNQKPAPRTTASLALVFLMASAMISSPASASSPEPDYSVADPCAGNIAVETGSFVVPEDTLQVVNRSTTIRADRVQILGILAASDARDGDAPTLCIEATELEVSGTLCTGRGLDGRASIAPTAMGEAGTGGGDLIIRLVANSTTEPLPPILTGTVCTGDGGDGGPAFATPDAPRFQTIDLKRLLQIDEVCRSVMQKISHPTDDLPDDSVNLNWNEPIHNAAPISYDLCLYVARVKAILDDPQAYVCSEIDSLHEAVPAACEPPGPGDLPGTGDLPGLDDVPPTCSLPGMNAVPVVCGPVPPQCSLPAVSQLPWVCQPAPCFTVNCFLALINCQDANCVPPAPTCQDVTGTPNCIPNTDAIEYFVLQVANLVLSVVGETCPGSLDPMAPCGVPLCQAPSAQAMALGGSGGSGGTLSWTMPWSLASTLPAGSLWPGSGGAGGNAISLGGGIATTYTLGGGGGASTALLNGFPFADPTPFASGSGGDGGLGFAMGNSALGLNCYGPCSIEDPVSCVIPCPADHANYMECIVQWTWEEAMGRPGDSDAQTGAVRPVGAKGADGKDGMYGPMMVIAIPPVGCDVQQPATNGGIGGEGGTGGYVRAAGGPGGGGLVFGGDGGKAHATAAPGQVGGAGGRGGHGFQPKAVCPTIPCGEGADGGEGGNSSNGEAIGGDGGRGTVRGGRGGDAQATTAAAGPGGPGGPGGIFFSIDTPGKCKGGCGGEGGEVQPIRTTVGDPGAGLLPNEKGQPINEGPPSGSKAPGGVSDPLAGRDCPTYN